MAFSTRTLVLSALVMSVASVSLAQRSPEQVQEAIKKALKKEKITLKVDIQGGNATLTGAVRNIFGQNKAVEIALEQEEVETVDVDIEISTAEDDNELGQEVVKQLRTYSNMSVFDDAGAIVKDGSVVLFGFVTEPFKKERLGKRMEDILGIQEFDNQIKVLPNSMSDNRLRRNLANRLYRDPMFSDFSRMAIPPIHIIVENSRVLLTGVAQNKMAIQKAESILRGVPGVLSVENRLRLGS